MWPVAGLLAVAVGSNAYLTHLFFRVKAASSTEAVASFCKVSDRVDCVRVAESAYSVVLGVPLSIWALEFFLVALGISLLSAFRRWPVRAWDSLVFLQLLLGLPVSLLMAWISIFRIESVCVLCSVVYGVNLLALAILWLAHRTRLWEFVREGPRELSQRLSHGWRWLGLLLALAAGLSQLLWLPRLLPMARAQAAPQRVAPSQDPWNDVPQRGLIAGREDAPVTLEIFTDFECPFCARLHQITHELLLRNKDRLRLVHRDYPLDQSCNRAVRRPFHQRACVAALYARCAAAQGKFWSYASLLFQRRAFDRASLDHHARVAGLAHGHLQACLRATDARQAVLEDVEEGIRRKLAGTPTAFLNGEQIRDKRMNDPSFWQELIDRAAATK